MRHVVTHYVLQDHHNVMLLGLRKAKIKHVAPPATVLEFRQLFRKIDTEVMFKQVFAEAMRKTIESIDRGGTQCISSIACFAPNPVSLCGMTHLQR